MCKPRLTLLTATLALLLLFPSPSRALIPLELVAEFQLPPNNAWDVQHWQSDSTYGWATVDDESLYVCLEVPDCTVSSMFVPADEPGWWGGGNNGEVLIYGNDDPSILAVLVVNMRWGGYDEEWRIVRMNALSGERIGDFRDLHLGIDGYGLSYFSHYRGSIVWPPPPHIAHGLFVIMVRDWWWDAAGNEGYGLNGSSFWLPLQDSVMSWGVFHYASRVSPYAVYDSVQVATAGFWQETHWWSSGPTVYTSSSWFTFFDLNHGTDVVDTLCHSSTHLGCGDALPIVAQTDADGTQRIVQTYRGWELEPVTQEYQEVWYNPQVVTPISATLELGQDERILVIQPDSHLKVYDASNGSCIDRTTAYEGAFQYVLKQPNRVSEFVTYEDSTRTIRIYCPGEALNVTITCDFDWLRLRWNRITGAQGYKVYATFPPIVNEWQPLATVIDTTWFFPIPAFDYGLYKVEPIY